MGPGCNQHCEKHGTHLEGVGVDSQQPELQAGHQPRDDDQAAAGPIKRGEGNLDESGKGNITETEEIKIKPIKTDEHTKKTRDSKKNRNTPQTKKTKKPEGENTDNR